jgi:hypothetical protein
MDHDNIAGIEHPLNSTAGLLQFQAQSAASNE